MTIAGLIVGILIATLLAGLIIWIVGKLGLGLEVSGLGTAFLAALVVAVVSALIAWLWGLMGYSPGGGLAGAIIHLLVTATVLLFADRGCAWAQGEGLYGGSDRCCGDWRCRLAGGPSAGRNRPGLEL